MAYLRQNSQLVKGDELWLFLGTTENQEVPTCFATQHSLSRSLSTTNVSSKDHGNTSFVIPGEGSWTCSTEALMSMTTTDSNAKAFVDIMDAYDTGALVYVKFGKLSNYTAAGIVDVDGATPWSLATPYWTGKGYITSLQASGGHGDSATFSIEITGIGPLVKTSGPTQYTITLNNTPALSGAISVSAQSATAGTTIGIVPTSGYPVSYGPDNVVITTSPSVSVEWQDAAWYFTMPANNVTITTALKYETTLTGTFASHYTLNGGATAPIYLLPGTEVEVTPTDPTYGDSSYAMRTNDGTTFTWSGSYFTATMPDYYNTSYTYLTIEPYQV